MFNNTKNARIFWELQCVLKVLIFDKSFTSLQLFIPLNYKHKQNRK